MKAAPFSMLLEAASKYNILALTTACATSCVFCSHHQNPREVEAYFISKLTMEQAENLIEFLNPEEKITIGESATRICEGEPFAFEHIMAVLELIRVKYPDTPIQITTSAINLEDTVLERLKTLGNIELNISLNSSSSEGRKKLYGGKEHMQALKAVERLREYGIKFNGSIVAMPHIVGWADLEQTILYLSSKGAATIRVFMPGYTKLTRIQLPEEDIMQKLWQMAVKLRKQSATPIIIEPSRIEDLDAVVEGVISDSPAAQTEIKPGDTILRVDGKSVFSRVEAYNRLFAAKNPAVDFKQQGKVKSGTIEKPADSTSGLVFNYDMAAENAVRIKRAVEKFSSKNCLMLTSRLGFAILKLVLRDCENIDIKIAENSYFGGNIMCAGLLVLQDIEDILQQQKIPEVLFLPQIMLDEKGRDLTGRHYMEIEQQYNLTVVIL
ncbi:MAG: radical superfamily enzymePDZ protein [Clostridia bacterium]|jgi:NifB/MoaA-like Fe-S oxidoreductase|nr:radical superfamily enzymePDZ protein [Clostridia bacterium]